MAKSYEEAGVKLEAGYEVVRRIKSHVASTARTGSMGNIGSFGGMFDLAALGLKEPVLVSGTEGVGTKLKIAFAIDTVGIDAVAMCVNDVLAQGAEPLFFLDYVALGENVPAKVEAIVAGVAEGCRQAGCALVGGETAEMPGMMRAANTTSPASRRGSSRSPASSTGRRSPSGTCWWASPPAGSIPTDSASCGKSSRMPDSPTPTRCPNWTAGGSATSC